MSLKKITLLLAIIGLWVTSVNAQLGESQWRDGKEVNEVYDHNWSFGAGVNIVEDGNIIIGGIIV